MSEIATAQLTEETFAEKMASLPRDVTIIVDDVPDLARAVHQHNRAAVLVSPTLAAADGLIVVEDLDALESRFFELGAPEAWVMARTDADAERFGAMCDKARLNYRTSNVRSRAWVDFLLTNIRLSTQPSLMRLIGKMRGVPAFVVGAGPSLDRNKHLMAEAKKVGIVIAVNGAGAALPEAPHVTLTIEAEDTRPLLRDTRDSIRAFSLSCHPDVMAHGSGPLSPVYLTNPTGVLRTLTGIPRLETSISASTTATSLAYIMGCSPIVLVGQDMSYPDGRTYSEGLGGGSLDAEGRYTWGELHKDLQRALSPLPDRESLVDCVAWGGAGTVRTSMPWATMRAYLASCAEVWDDTALVNCTEGGARVEGWAEAPLEWLLGLLRERGCSAPTTAELVERMTAEGPLVPPQVLGDFLAAQSVAAAVTSARAGVIGSLARVCASTHGELPRPVRELLDWIWAPSPWAKAWTERGVNAGLEYYQRTPPLSDISEERLAGAWVLASACEVIEQEARSLSDRIQEAT